MIMTPERDIMHYARLAELAYKDKYDEAGETIAPIYDLSGRRVNEAVRGLYIQDGKKI